MLGFPGVASSALETVCETRDRCGKCGGISRSSAHLLCVGWAGKAPQLKHSQDYVAGHEPDLVTLMSWYSGLESWIAWIQAPCFSRVFLPKSKLCWFFFLLVSKQCYSLAESLLFQSTGKVWSRQGEASLCGEDFAEGGREAGAGKEIRVSILIQGLRKLKFS